MTTITVEPHNPTWALEFNRIKTSLEGILKNVPITSIEHVGSTSIADLLAKPILDIDIIVKPENLPAARKALSNAGYEDRVDLVNPGRYMFRQPVTGEKGMRRNTNVILDGSLALRNHLDTRRILRGDEGLRREYGNVKVQLIESGIDDINVYSNGKTEVVFRALRKAGWSEEDLEEVRRANEA